MIDELDAIRDSLLVLGWPVHYVDAPEHPDALPYLVLGSSSGRMFGPALCADLTDLDDVLRVMVVHHNPEAVVVAQGQVRAVLHNTHPPVVERSVTVRLLGSEPVAVDRDMTLPLTNRHPAYGVDIYRLTSVPAPLPPPPPPVLGSMAPTTGPTSGGTALSVTGSGFTGATGLRIGGVLAAAFTVATDTAITASTPAHAPGSVPVVLEHPHGNVAGPNFTYADPLPPAMDTITPNTGPTTGGTALTITGHGFTGATQLLIGGIDAALVVVNDTTLTGTTPPNTAGPKGVFLRTPGGNASQPGAFTYTDPLEVVP